MIGEVDHLFVKTADSWGLAKELVARINGYDPLLDDDWMLDEIRTNLGAYPETLVATHKDAFVARFVCKDLLPRMWERIELRQTGMEPRE